jgi:formylmethanofuran dehydrogenase subunit D
VKNKKLVVVGGEKALLVRHLSSFSYIDAEDEVGTPFQALSIVEPTKKGTSSFASYKDVRLAIEHGTTTGLGQMIKLEDNKSRAGIGYSSGVFNKQGMFKSGGFIHTGQDKEVVVIVEEDAEEDSGNFVIPGGVCNNWVVVDIPTVIHKSK